LSPHEHVLCFFVGAVGALSRAMDLKDTRPSQEHVLSFFESPVATGSSTTMDTRRRGSWCSPEGAVESVCGADPFWW